jgi:hypothetical protein
MYRPTLLCILIVACAKGDFREGHGEGDDTIFTPEQQKALRSRSISLDFPAWTNARVPYVMDPGFSGSALHTTALKKAIAELQNKTCVRIFPRTTEKNYLKFKNSGPNGGCSSYVGVLPEYYQPQEVNIADWCCGDRWFSTVHELTHALGFMHEQCRPDRDSYVNVNMNSPYAQNVNYQKVPQNKAKIVTKYDYESIMHYPASDNLLTPKIKVNIGQRDHLSNCDIAKINRHYNCPAPYAQNCPKA